MNCFSKDYIRGGIYSPILSKSKKETSTLIRKRNFLKYKKQEAIAHFQNILCYDGPSTDHNHYLDNLEGFTWSPQHKESLNRRITQEEIKNAIFSLNDSEAPGPDGFTSLFFKKAWSIVGSDVTEAVESFFDSGCMLREINCTIIALVPKVPNPESMHDYRPISCCNTIYKCISKIIASRIKMCLPDIINPSQSAFVHGRSIADNVLITQDLMHKYHRNNGRPRCALKIDIKKAYDTIGWSCVIDILSRLGTPANIVFFWINKNLFQRGKTQQRIHTKSKDPKKTKNGQHLP